MFQIEPTITKEFLLTKNSEERYMTYYLGVPVTKRLFKSPIRVDHRETCSFYRNRKGELRYKDFGEGYNLNFVEVVMQIHKCSFHKALKIIANDFGIISLSIPKNTPKIEYNGEIFEKSESCEIQVEIKEFSKEELAWWESFGVSMEILKRYDIYSIKTVFLNGIPNFFSSEKVPIYGYYSGIEEGRELWKIYFPTKIKFRFLLNHGKIQGLSKLPKTGDLLIITKSLKDVACLSSMGYNAIAPQSENAVITKEQFESLSKRFKKILVMFDNDSAGLKSMIKMRKKFPVYVTYIWKKHHVKDISDYFKKYKREKTIKFMNNLIADVNSGKLDYHITKYEKFRK